MSMEQNSQQPADYSASSTYWLPDPQSLTASGVGGDIRSVVDAMVERVEELESALVAAPRSWDPDLHPRGKDGKFIEKFGFVKWLTKLGDVETGQVIGIDDRDHIKVKRPDGSTVNKRARDIEATSKPKAKLAKPASKTPKAPVGKLTDDEWDFFEKKYPGISKSKDTPGEEFVYWMNKGVDPRKSGDDWSGDSQVDVALSKLFEDNDRDGAIEYIGNAVYGTPSAETSDAPDAPDVDVTPEAAARRMLDGVSSGDEIGDLDPDFLKSIEDLPVEEQLPALDALENALSRELDDEVSDEYITRSEAGGVWDAIKPLLDDYREAWKDNAEDRARPSVDTGADAVPGTDAGTSVLTPDDESFIDGLFSTDDMGDPDTARGDRFVDYGPENLPDALRQRLEAADDEEAGQILEAMRDRLMDKIANSRAEMKKQAYDRGDRDSADMTADSYEEGIGDFIGNLYDELTDANDPGMPWAREDSKVEAPGDAVPDGAPSGKSISREQLMAIRNSGDQPNDYEKDDPARTFLTAMKNGATVDQAIERVRSTGVDVTDGDTAPDAPASTIPAWKNPELRGTEHDVELPDGTTVTMKRPTSDDYGRSTSKQIGEALAGKGPVDPDTLKQLYAANEGSDLYIPGDDVSKSLSGETDYRNAYDALRDAGADVSLLPNPHSEPIYTIPGDDELPDIPDTPRNREQETALDDWTRDYDSSGIEDRLTLDEADIVDRARNAVIDGADSEENPVALQRDVLRIMEKYEREGDTEVMDYMNRLDDIMDGRLDTRDQYATWNDSVADEVLDEVDPLPDEVDRLEEVRDLYEDLDMEIADPKVKDLLADVETILTDDELAEDLRPETVDNLRKMADDLDNGNIEQGNLDLGPYLRELADELDNPGGGDTSPADSGGEPNPFTDMEPETIATRVIEAIDGATVYNLLDDGDPRRENPDWPDVLAGLSELLPDLTFTDDGEVFEGDRKIPLVVDWDSGTGEILFEEPSGPRDANTKQDFASYFNVADELSDFGGEPLTLDDLDADFVAEAKRSADELGLPWPPDLATAEEYALDNPDIRRVDPDGGDGPSAPSDGQPPIGRPGVSVADLTSTFRSLQDSGDLSEDDVTETEQILEQLGNGGRDANGYGFDEYRQLELVDEFDDRAWDLHEAGKPEAAQFFADLAHKIDRLDMADIDGTGTDSAGSAADYKVAGTPNTQAQWTLNALNQAADDLDDEDISFEYAVPNDDGTVDLYLPLGDGQTAELVATVSMDDSGNLSVDADTPFDDEYSDKWTRPVSELDSDITTSADAEGSIAAKANDAMAKVAEIADDPDSGMTDTERYVLENFVTSIRDGVDMNTGVERIVSDMDKANRFRELIDMLLDLKEQDSTPESNLRKLVTKLMLPDELDAQTKVKRKPTTGAKMHEADTLANTLIREGLFEGGLTDRAMDVMSEFDALLAQLAEELGTTKQALRTQFIEKAKKDNGKA